MKIRRAINQDLKEIQQLNLDHFNYEIDLFDDTFDNRWPLSKKGLEYFRRNISNKKSIIFVAEENDKIIGMVVGEISPKDYSRKPEIIVAEMKQLFVAENYRSQRIGSALVQEYFKWAKEQGATRAQVYASATNVDGIRFYKKHGFADFDVVLEKELK